jgi:N-acetylglucosaminyldiphosphoundecaprenol N-acetyl-beta-D-mannosaminyltransferase
MARTEPPLRPAPAQPAVHAHPRTRVLGVPVHALTLDEAVGAAAAAIGAAAPLRVAVVNANKAWLARRDAAVRELLEQAELVIPEYATAWAARRLGVPGVHHIGGITLMVRLLEEAAARRWGVYLLGARPGVVAALRARLEAAEPPVRVIGHHHGYLDEAAAAHVRAVLAERVPDVLFVAMGSPLQERFMATLDPAAVRVVVGVGGSFDVLAGHKQDAPAWARGRGLEWLVRLIQDPRRLWRRYLVTNTWFVWQVARTRLRQRPGRRAP